MALLRERPDWRTVQATPDRYRRWSVEVERVLDGLSGATVGAAR